MNKSGGKRRPGTRGFKTNPVMFIACHGETETKYIKDFIKAHNNSQPSPYIKVKPYKSKHLALVYDVQRFLAYPENQNYDTNNTWLVFDADLSRERPSEEENFNQTINNDLGYKAAWSNPCVEMWFLLHFNKYDTGCNQDWCKEKFIEIYKKRGNIICQKKQVINKCGCACDFSSYDKAASPVYCITETRLIHAKERARKLLDNSEYYGQKRYHKINPGTTMHELLAAIEDYLKKYG